MNLATKSDMILFLRQATESDRSYLKRDYLLKFMDYFDLPNLMKATNEQLRTFIKNEFGKDFE